jgi:hypothetical protein
VEDFDEVSLLTVPVDAPVPLLHAVRVPRDFVVDEPVTMGLSAKYADGSCRLPSDSRLEVLAN